ncbi:MAG: hypothetical protein ABH804_00760 [archaeon]
MDLNKLRNEIERYEIPLDYLKNNSWRVSPNSEYIEDIYIRLCFIEAKLFSLPENLEKNSLIRKINNLREIFKQIDFSPATQIFPSKLINLSDIFF